MPRALAQGASWRWVFYINTSLGPVLYAAFILSIQPLANPTQAFTSFSHLIRTLDLIGMAALVPTMVCLFLALQWGGNSHSWPDGRIITLLVVTGVLGLAFIALEFWQGEKAMLPSHIFTQSSVSYTSLYGFCSSGAIYILTYYISEWFQGVKGASPLMPAVYTLPWLITSVITLLGCGVLISKIGHVDIWMLVGTVFGAVGSGLFTTFTPDTSPVKWIGYQIIFSIGSSLFSVTPFIIIQSQLTLKDIAIGSGMVAFSQVMGRFVFTITSCLPLGSSIFVSIAQVVFTENLASSLQQLGIQGLQGAVVASSTGLTGLTNALSGDLKKTVLTVINDSLVDLWRLPSRFVVHTSVAQSYPQPSKPTRDQLGSWARAVENGWASFWPNLDVSLTDIRIRHSFGNVQRMRHCLSRDVFNPAYGLVQYDRML